MPAGPRGDYGVSYTDRFQTHYGTVLVTMYQESGAWIITIADPFGAGTAGKVSGSVAAAKQHALVVAKRVSTEHVPGSFVARDPGSAGQVEEDSTVANLKLFFRDSPPPP